MKNIRFFLSENVHFLVVKISVYLNRRLFVMVMAHRMPWVCTFCIYSKPHFRLTWSIWSFAHVMEDFITGDVTNLTAQQSERALRLLQAV